MVGCTAGELLRQVRYYCHRREKCCKTSHQPAQQVGGEDHPPLQVPALCSQARRTAMACDLWHQLYLLDGGQRARASTPSAKRRATLCSGSVGDNGAMGGWTRSIELTVATLIRDITIRNKFEDCVDIPPNHQYARSFKLSRAHMKAYETMRDDRLLQLKKTTVTAGQCCGGGWKIITSGVGRCL